MLTSAQVEEYRDRGYLGVEGVLSPSELKELQDVTDEFVEQSRKITEHTGIFDLEPDHTPEFPKVRRLKEPIWSTRRIIGLYATTESWISWPNSSAPSRSASTARSSI